MQPPQSPIPTPDGYLPPRPEPQPGQVPGRGGCLTVLLILMFIANPLVGVGYLFGASHIRISMPGLPGWAIPMMGIAAFINLACAIAIWNRRRWGVYVFLGVAAVTFLVNSMTQGFTTGLAGLLGVAVLVALVSQEWKYYMK